MPTHSRFARSAYASRERPTFFQFVVLSMLLHLLLIVLIGDSIRTGARRGDGFLGSLDVTLRRTPPAPGAGVKLAPGADTSSPRAALLRRFGGSADTPTPARVEPPPIPAPRTQEERSIEDSPPAVAAPPSAQEAPLPQPAARPFEALPPLDLNAPEIVDRPLPPPAVSPPVVEHQASPAAVRPPTVAPAVPPLLERIVPRAIERELAPRVELAPREAPISPAPLERIAPRQIEREIAPPVEFRPRELPITSEPIERIAPARIERELAPPVELSVREAPPLAAPMERIAPAQVDRLADVPAPASTRPAEPATTPAERAAPGADRSAPASVAPQGVPGEPPARLRFGTPQPDDDMFKPRRDVVVPPAEPGGLPRIDRDAARARAREIAREGLSSRALVQVDLPLLERPPKNSFDKAARPDCRTAYAGLGLLAIPVLLASALADTGCRW